ncbi:hypothetical protein ABIC08_006370 [Bradyrhizobium sp. RT9b]|uniref:hypothetical protein n=1 Tax=Bradyrhizobium sp. RT9b TaxID=3156385 RepID=UPI003391442A
MSTNRTGQANASSKAAGKGHAHDDVLSLNGGAPPRQALPTTDSSPAKHPEAANEELARWIGQKVLDGIADGSAILKRNWKSVALALVSATGLSTAVATLPLSQVREMDGYAPGLKPQRDCKAPLSRTSTSKEIDDFLADPSNYGNPQKDVWEISVSASGAFTGTQWFRKRGESPMRVTGYIANGDWIDGAIRGVKGHGAYHLEARNNEEIYRGTFTALECSLPQDTMIVCPYSLVPKDTPEAEAGLAGRVCRRYYGTETKVDTP